MNEIENNNQINTEENLPFCTTAASAEHARATNEDEPCDDNRAGIGRVKEEIPKEGK